ncbi:MAG: hypothetical protein C4575_09240 [Desulforudis sp.]|nr:MAG: hypothetical protein C4575_09240 [Desulforudis sp.]
MTIGEAPICVYCKYFTRDKNATAITCRAFPLKVPREIVMGEIKHIEAYPGQSGDYVFEVDEKWRALYQQYLENSKLG